jgi:hypothetical protein
MNTLSNGNYTSGMVVSFRTVDAIIENLRATGQLTEDVCVKLVHYKEMQCWKGEDFLTLAVSRDKFLQYYKDHQLTYFHRFNKNPGDVVGEAALLEQAPR